MINIKEVSWCNFRGYGNYVSKLSLDQYPGVCLIEGEIDENREEGDEKLNGSGKSSIIEAITWALFGSLTHKEKPGDSIINWNTKSNCRVSIKTNDNYEIVRTRKFNGKSELLVYKDGIDETHSTTLPAQSYINNTFGLDYKIFINSVIFGQFNNGFLEQSDSKIRSILEKLMQIDNIDSIASTAKLKIQKIKENLSSYNTKKELIERNINNLKEQIDELKEKELEYTKLNLEKIKKLKNSIIEYNDNLKIKKDTINKSIKEKENKLFSLSKINIDYIKLEWENYNNKIKKLKDAINNTKESIDNLNNKILKLKLDISKVDDEINIDECIIENNIYNNTHEKYLKLNSDYASCETNISTQITIINNENNKIQKLKSLKAICDNCLRPVNDDDKNNIIHKCNNIINIAEQSIKDYKDNLNKLREEINNLKNKLNNKPISVEKATEYNNNREKILINNKKINDEIKKLNEELNSNKNKLSKLDNIVIDTPDTNLEEAKLNNDLYDQIFNSINNEREQLNNLDKELKNYVNSVKEEISNINNLDNPFTSIIENKLNDLNFANNELIDIDKDINLNNTLFNHIDYIKESYSNKKKIRSFWIGKLIPQFNELLKYYLNYFEIDDKIEFDSLLSVKINRWSYEDHSGGERRRIDLSIMFALFDLYLSNFGQQSNLMILDEIDGRLDPFTINKLAILLNDDIIKRNNGVTNIFVISHRKEMKDKFPYRVRVKNKSGYAYITNG